MSDSIREEVVNTLLATELAGRGFFAMPETIRRQGRPDVLIRVGGIKIVIEGRFHPANNLLNTVEDRIEKGMADICLGLVYPDTLRRSDSMPGTVRKIHASSYEAVVCNFARQGKQIMSLPNISFDGLVPLLNQVCRVLIENDLVRDHVSRVESDMKEFVEELRRDGSYFTSSSLIQRLQETLAIEKPSNDKSKGPVHLLQMAAFILFDAMVFQGALANVRTGVPSLNDATEPLQTFFEISWKRILKINYEAIFSIALQILKDFPNNQQTSRLLKLLTDSAINVLRSGILAKHDFMGRIYHKLLLTTTGKFYATNYTSVPAAWLLSSLTVNHPGVYPKFQSIKDIKQIRVLDPACGSGTLLSATYMAIKDRAIVDGNIMPDLNLFHKNLLEEVIHGWDVLGFAAHLTLLSLALHNFRARFEKENIYVMQTGVGDDGRGLLGSLSLLDPQESFRGHTFRDDRQVNLRGDRPVIATPNEKYDYVVVNPPFLRAAKPNVKFGYEDKNDKAKMESRLKELAEEHDLIGAGPAGLGPFFVTLADKLLKPGGRMAFILPRAMLSGVAWKATRKLLTEKYHLLYVLSNLDPEPVNHALYAWSWSEHTDLGEIMFIAQKPLSGETPGSLQPLRYVNIARCPKNEVEAMMISCQIVDAVKRNERRCFSLELDGKPVGHVLQLPQGAVGSNLLFPGFFAQAPLNQLMVRMRQHAEAHFGRLETLMESSGIDISPLKGRFTKSRHTSEFPIVWGQNNRMNTLILGRQFVGYGAATSPTKSRIMFDKYSASLLISERPHFDNDAVVAFQSPVSVLATAQWEVRLKDLRQNAALILWLNSTYGLLCYLTESTSSQGGIIKMKKGQLTEIRCPNFDEFDHEAVKNLFRDVARRPLLSFGEEFALAAKGEGVRRIIDRFFARRLAFKIDLNEVYQLFAREPLVTGRRFPESEAFSENQRRILPA